MATAYIFQGFGSYEENDKGEKGLTVSFAGVPFWLPYQKVTAIPNWTFREVDHDKSTPQSGQVAVLTYQNTIVNGDVIANQIVERGIPDSGKDMGILRIEGKPTGRTIVVAAGCTADGDVLTAEVAEREATKVEVERAAKAADSYKRKIVADYLQSKRQKMSGGNGKSQPTGLERTFMDELGMEDVDDVTAHAKNSGMNPDFIKNLVSEILAANNEGMGEAIVQAVKTVRASTKAQLGPAAGQNKLTVAPLSEEEKARRKAIGERLMAGKKAKQQQVEEVKA